MLNNLKKSIIPPSHVVRSRFHLVFFVAVDEVLRDVTWGDALQRTEDYHRV